MGGRPSDVQPRPISSVGDQMKQVLLAIFLIAIPVAAFTGVEFYATGADSSAAAGLGDLSSLKAIIADVQTLAARGDIPGAAKRVTDFESAWDQGETAYSPAKPRPIGETSTRRRTLLSKRSGRPTRCRTRSRNPCPI